jgi:hypothetical protein
MNPFLALPSELIDSYLSSSNFYANPHLVTIGIFTSLLRLHLVDRASYSRFESFRGLKVLGVLNKLSLAYATNPMWQNTDISSILLWTRISRLALCHDSYRQTIDEFFEEKRAFESHFLSFVIGSVQSHIHESQYNDTYISMSHLGRCYSVMTREQQRLLAYHCASMFIYNCDERTMISRLAYPTCISRIYAYDHQKHANGQDGSGGDYLVDLHNDVTIKIDVRYLVPLSLPLAYSNNEMLYVVENAYRSFAEVPSFTSSETLGCLAPPLCVESLLKCIQETDAFRVCLNDCVRAIRSKKKSARKRIATSNRDTHTLPVKKNTRSRCQA